MDGCSVYMAVLSSQREAKETDSKNMRKLLMSYSCYLFLNNLIKSMYKIQTFNLPSLPPSFCKAMSASCPIKGPSGHLKHRITNITGIHPSVCLFRMQALGNGDATAGQRLTVAGRPHFHLRQEEMEQRAACALSGHHVEPWRAPLYLALREEL